MCLPSFDSPAVFGRILDWRTGGHFQVRPRDVQSVSRRYLPNINVLETTVQTPAGNATLTDFMPVSPRGSASMAGGDADNSVRHRQAFSHLALIDNATALHRHGTSAPQAAVAMG